MSEPVAIIGAGMAGLACATALAERGIETRLFDKGRGPGGRMSTRRVEIGGQTVRFDHGAQYFTARDEAFRTKVGQWQDAGVAAPWPAAGDDAWVGTPAMNAPIRHMAGALDVEWATRCDSLARDGERWILGFGERQESFAKVVSAIPAEQAAELLSPAAPELAQLASSAKSDPCWALMLAFEEPLPLEEDVLRPESGRIGWAARDSAKPGRAPGERWVVHASAAWSREILEHSPDAAADAILTAFFEVTACPPVEPSHSAAHRWRYAKVDPADASAPAVWDAQRGIGLAGDWLVGPRVGDAWASGHALAAMMAP